MLVTIFAEQNTSHKPRVSLKTQIRVQDTLCRARQLPTEHVPHLGHATSSTITLVVLVTEATMHNVHTGNRHSCCRFYSDDNLLTFASQQLLF